MYSVGVAVEVRTTNLVPTDAPCGIGVSSSLIENPPGVLDVSVGVGATVLATVDDGDGPGSLSATVGAAWPSTPTAVATARRIRRTCTRNRTSDTVRRQAEATT
jgi:hypothetical protein